MRRKRVAKAAARRFGGPRRMDTLVTRFMDLPQAALRALDPASRIAPVDGEHAPNRNKACQGWDPALEMNQSPSGSILLRRSSCSSAMARLLFKAARATSLSACMCISEIPRQA
jgi:hypothetical protein